MYIEDDYWLILGRREVVQQIYPVNYDTVFPFIGEKVCAVTLDGTHYYGTVGDISDGRILLTECMIGNQTLALASVKTAGKIKKKVPKREAKVSGFYGGYGFGFGSFWLDLALISLLFFLPFFLI
jgi:hypothetical protein